MNQNLPQQMLKWLQRKVFKSSDLRFDKSFKKLEADSVGSSLIGEWIGQINYLEDSFQIKMIIDSDNPDILGRMQVQDSYSQRWLEFGVMENTICAGDVLQGETNSGLQFEFQLNGNQLTGPLYFPDTENYEGFSATTQLNFVTKVYLPLISR